MRCRRSLWAYLQVRLVDHGWVVVDALARHPQYAPPDSAKTAAFNPEAFQAMSEVGDEVIANADLALKELADLQATASGPWQNSRLLTLLGLAVGALGLYGGNRTSQSQIRNSPVIIIY